MHSITAMDTFYHQRRQHREQRMDQNYEDDEQSDPDYLMALRLSAELNGPGGESSTNPLRNSKKKIGDMLGVFSRGNKTLDQSQAKRKSPAALLTPSARSIAVSEPASKTDEKPDRVVNYEPETPSSCLDLDTFAAFIHHIKTRTCSRCKRPFFESSVDLLTLFQNWIDGAVDKLSCTVRCKACYTKMCITCTQEPFSKPSNSMVQGSRQQVSWCCVSGRLFLIWTLLCGFDSRRLESRKVDKNAKASTSELGPNSPIHDRGRTKRSYGNGVGYGSSRYPLSSLPKGTGYNTFAYDGFVNDGTSDHDEYDSDFEFEIHTLLKATDHTSSMWKKLPSAENKNDIVPHAQSAQITEDRFSKLILGFLSDLFPSLERETCFDYDPPVAVFEMLTGSKILNYCAELLRNDSLADIVQRKDLYQTLFSFLSVLGSHSCTSLALFSARSVRPETVNLVTLSFCDETFEQNEKVTSLADCLRNLAAQSSFLLQNAAKNAADFANEEGQTMLKICRQVSDLAQFIETNNPSHSLGRPKTADAVISDEIRFASIEEKHILPTYRFALDARRLLTSKPGRFKRLITEITTLQTGLPPGIFVRYCENRPDILKCVIIGPLGTPYENGLFEFDIFCGGNFPTDPPTVSFKGTGGGKVSINPNLYSDGKVCLSLLGTWPGERWNSKESTLLQVLISIQAMILCEEPWYNEPGREADYGPPRANSPSEIYNRRVHHDTLRYALLYHWLEKTPELWKDVVAHHFTRHGDDILKKVEEWVNDAAKAPPSPRHRYSEFGDSWDFSEQMMPGPMSRDKAAASRKPVSSMISDLQNALQKYGVTYKIKYFPPPPEALQPPRPHSESGHPASPYGPLTATWGQPEPQNHSLFDYPVYPPNPEYWSLYHPPPPSTLDTNQGTMAGSPPHGVGSVPQASKPPPPGPLIVSSSGPPSSNTRSAARGRGSGAQGSVSRGRGGPSQGSSVPTFGRGGPSHSSVPLFGRGRGVDGFNPPGGSSPEFSFPDTTRGGHAGRGGRGRGRGRGDSRGRGY